MQETRELKVALSSLSDPELRTQWLRQKLQRWPSFLAALAACELVDESENAGEVARQAMYSLVSAIVREPQAALWATLRDEAKLRDLLGLQRLLRQEEPPRTLLDDDEKPAVPDYGTGRELTLGERRALARRPQRKWIERLLRDPHPMVIELLLQNPKLTQTDVLRLVTSRRVRANILGAIVRCERWLSDGHVRQALILNPATPPSITIPLLFLCTRPQLREIKSTTNLLLGLRATAAELLQRRPPSEVKGFDSDALH